jgi:hypothetical protein
MKHFGCLFGGVTVALGVLALFCLLPILLVVMIAGAAKSLPSPSDRSPICKHCLFLGDTITVPQGSHGPAICF